MWVSVTLGTVDINQILFKFLYFYAKKEYSICSKYLDTFYLCFYKMIINQIDVVKVVPELLYIAMNNNFVLGWDKQVETETSQTSIEKDILT